MSSHEKARIRSLFLNSLNTNECIRQIKRFWYSLFARICILLATCRCYIHGDGNVNRAEKGISFFTIQHSSSRHFSSLTTLPLLDWLYDLFHKIWNAETIPEDWCRGLIVKLPKKGDRTQCTNWRGVTLLSVPSKIFCKIIHMRLSDAIDTILRKEQAGFRPGVGCIDHIFTLRNIFEQCIEWNTKVHVNFIDLEKAFDSIHRDTLWNILLAYGCPEKIVNIIKLFYNNFTCSVIHKKKLTDWFSVRSGVRQGCVLSPMLFLVAID